MKEPVEIVRLHVKNNDTTQQYPLEAKKNLPYFFQDYQAQNHALDDEGNTALHRAIINFNEFKLESLITRSNNSSISAMARTVNNKGQLPIDIVLDMPSNEIKEKIIPLLLPFYEYSHLKKLSEFIDSKDIIERYDSLSSGIVKNLQIACTVVNQSRSKIIASYTHPEINTCSHED